MFHQRSVRAGGHVATAGASIKADEGRAPAGLRESMGNDFARGHEQAIRGILRMEGHLRGEEGGVELFKPAQAPWSKGL